MPYDALQVYGKKIHANTGSKDDVRILAREIDGKFATTTTGAIIKVSNGDLIPMDEPLFLFRARDNKALKVLAYYRELCAVEENSQWQVDGITAIIEQFVEFKVEHPERMKQPGITRGK